MIVVLDANILVHDFQLRSPRWDQIKAAVADSRMRVLVPSIAIVEAKHQGEAATRKLARELEALSRKLGGEPADQVANAAAATRKAADDYSTWLDSKLTEFGFTVVRSPYIDHDELAERAVRRQRPFNESGGGYRDTLHWMTLIEVGETDPDEDYVLLSADKKAFANAKDDARLHDQLLEEAAEVISGEVTLVTELSQFEIPGRYRRDVDADDYEGFLITTIEDVLEDDLFVSGLDPKSLSFSEAEWMEFSHPSHMQMRTIVARELNGSHDVEVEFELAATVQVYAPMVAYDNGGEAHLTSNGGDRRILVSGIANYPGGREDEVHLTDLEVRPAVPVFTEAQLKTVQSFLAAFENAKTTAVPPALGTVAAMMQLLADAQEQLGGSDPEPTEDSAGG